MPQTKTGRFKPIFKLILVGLSITLAITVSRQINLQESFQTAVLGVRNLGWWAPIAYILLYNLATLLFIPGSIMTIKGGCLFGLVWGCVYVLIGSMLGATAAFLVGRYLSRDWVSQRLGDYPKFKALDQAVRQEGWKIVLLTRLSPLFPFNLLNYAFGVTQVSLRDYVLGSLGMFPASVAYVCIGSLATDLTMGASLPQTREIQVLHWMLQALGAIATITVTIYLARLAQKALDRHLLPEEEYSRD